MKTLGLCENPCETLSFSLNTVWKFWSFHEHPKVFVKAHVKPKGFMKILWNLRFYEKLKLKFLVYSVLEPAVGYLNTLHYKSQQGSHPTLV